MARVNKWKQFGDAFSAVYDAGTTIGAAIETGGIAMKDYEDEEGNKLTGLALDRAKMDDYAGVELKYGDPLKALKMRTGVESLGQNRIRTDNLQDDLTSIRGLRDSSAGLNIANMNKINLGTRIRQSSEAEEIDANKAAFTMETARDTGLKKSYQNPAYVDSLVSGYEADAAESAANAVRFKSKAYTDFLESKDLADTAANQERYVASNINRSIMENEEYQTNYIANELVMMKRTLKTNEIANMIAQDPKTAEIAKNNLASALNNSAVAVSNSEVAKLIAENPKVQEYKVQAGLSNAELSSLSAQDQVIAAQRSLQLNKFITEWGKTSDPKDPTSMLTFIEGIKAIDPERGMALEKKYGEHELWEITNNSLLMKAEANEALATKGPEGVREILDKYNGDKLGVRLDKGPDGSYQLVETRAVGAGGEGSKQTEVVRIIAQGKDETEFMTDITAVLDPASLMEYSMNLADIKYKEGVTAYNVAQAKAALVKKPLTMDQWAAGVIQDPKASLFDKQLALALAIKDNPELFQKLSGMMEVDSKLKGKGLTNKDIGAKIPSAVNIDGPKSQEEQAAASSILDTLAKPDSTAKERESLLTGTNRKLLAKYHPEVLIMEDNKTDVAKEFIEAFDDGDITLSKEGINELVAKFSTIANAPKKTGMANRNDASNKANASRLAATLQSKPADVLQVVISELRSRIKDISGLSKGPGQRTTGGINKRNQEVSSQIQKLQALITELTKDR